MSVLDVLRAARPHVQAGASPVAVIESLSAGETRDEALSALFVESGGASDLEAYAAEHGTEGCVDWLESAIRAESEL